MFNLVKICNILELCVQEYFVLYFEHFPYKYNSFCILSIYSDSYQIALTMKLLTLTTLMIITSALTIE